MYTLCVVTLCVACCNNGYNKQYKRESLPLVKRSQHWGPFGSCWTWVGLLGAFKWTSGRINNSRYSQRSKTPTIVVFCWVNIVRGPYCLHWPFCWVNIACGHYFFDSTAAGKTVSSLASLTLVLYKSPQPPFTVLNFIQLLLTNTGLFKYINCQNTQLLFFSAYYGSLW